MCSEKKKGCPHTVYQTGTLTPEARPEKSEMPIRQTYKMRTGGVSVGHGDKMCIATSMVTCVHRVSEMWISQACE